ncbi:MAG: methylated-DNA--[protein]-cysteine S-methyltransferase [Gammaproteobacteria bacterium]|nr:methylated-DNA--[protein]-cysteine S-methyltransferase [Gammaproteobacteria bacterium]
MRNLTASNADTFYDAYLNNDTSYEGIFFMAVRTTGIFCRPGCTARTPKRENVEFFSSTHEALEMGYRPCKKCKPMSPKGEVPDWVKQALDMASKQQDYRISDAELKGSQIDPARLRRWFKKNHAMTFQAYQRLLRIGRAYGQIKLGQKVIHSAFDNGYNSLSGFNETFKKITGFSPSNSKKQKIIQITRLLTPLGPMFAAASDDGLCLLEFTDRRALEKQMSRVQKRLSAVFVAGNHEIFIQLQKQLDEYFSQQRTQFDIKLDVTGTDFQRSAWSALQAIPYAETRSYHQQAVALSKPDAVRAVGTANGMNAISIVIPCHRVIAKNGDLAGFGGGLWRKQYLINLEQNNKEE